MGPECLPRDLAACGHRWDPIIPLERGEGNFSQTPWLLRKGGEEQSAAPYPLEKKAKRGRSCLTDLHKVRD